MSPTAALRAAIRKAAGHFPSVWAVLAATAILMAFLYELHKHQAVWEIALTRRILPLKGIAAITLGTLIV